MSKIQNVMTCHVFPRDIVYKDKPVKSPRKPMSYKFRKTFNDQILLLILKHSESFPLFFTSKFFIFNFFICNFLLNINFCFFFSFFFYFLIIFIFNFSKSYILPLTNVWLNFERQERWFLNSYFCFVFSKV